MGRYHSLMSDVIDATKIAREWAVEQIGVEPAAWPLGAYCGVGEPADYFVFRVIDRALYVGGDHYIAVHKLTGIVHDLGYVGE